MPHMFESISEKQKRVYDFYKELERKGLVDFEIPSNKKL